MRKIVKIHNKYYDVTNFDHPGGRIAIMAANRRDATALFESHHPFSDKSMMETTLKKYEMCDEREKCDKYLLPNETENENYNLFDWKETLQSEFVIELRDKVKNHFQQLATQQGISIREATKATPQKWCEWGGFISACFWSFYTMLYSNSLFWSWINVIFFPSLYWLSGSMFHDGSHFAISTDWRVNWGMQYMYRVLSSPFDWLHQHIIGHHPYTNIYHKDPDLHHSGGELRITEKDTWDPRHKGQENKYFIMSLLLLLGFNIKNTVLLLVSRKYNNCIHKIPLPIKFDVLIFLDMMLYIYIFFVLPFYIWSPFYAVKHAIIPYFILSIIFVLNSSVNHTQKNSINGRHKNWYIHQITTSNNFGGRICYYLSIGLNYQIEHHLFPCVNHCHYHDIQPIVRQLCAKYNIPYNYTDGYKEALKGVYEHLREMGMGMGMGAAAEAEAETGIEPEHELKIQ